MRRAALLSILLLGCHSLPSTPACTDFYQYVNGRWLATHPVPPDQTFWGMSSDAVAGTQQRLRTTLEESPRTKIGTFYANCMDVDAIDRAGIEPLRSELARIASIQNRAELQDAIAHLLTIGISAPFDFDSATDAKNSDRVIAEISQAGLGLPDPSDYTGESPLRAEYAKSIATTLRLAGIDGNPDDVLRIETALAHASMTRAMRRSDPNATYNITTLDELRKLAPAIDWPRYFAAIGVNVQSVNVAQPDFLREVNRLAESTPLSAWRTYLAWHLLQPFAPWLSTPFAEEAARFNAVLTGRKSDEPRWRRCVAATDVQLGEQLGQAYVARYFQPEAKKRVDAMVDNIIAALRDDFSRVSWMSETTRAEAIAKVDAVKRKIGYPDRWHDDSALAIAPGSVVANIIAARSFLVRERLSRIGKEVDRDEWAMTPQTWNAYNNYEKNEIVFPAGILQWPRFDASLDDAFNYGSIGSVIGHELTHGFDDLGRRWDANGNVRDWWTAADAQAFNERAQCIIEQFESYEAAPGLHHSGKLVAGESIADLGGLILAWEAWQRARGPHPDETAIDGFTPEQRFFIAYAQARAANLTPEVERRLIETDTHPMSRLRVNGPLSNMPQFATAFQCTSGDPMVRATRCEIW